MLERIKPLTGLVSEILDQLPESVWISDSTTFFDPAIGGGQFVKVIERRLRSYGHSDNNIRQRVFGFEYSQALVDLAVNMHKLVGQYRKMPYEDFFTLDKKMKFDVIVGNPPYQDSSKTEKGGTTLWSVFLKKNVNELVKKDGYVAMVTPIAWMTFGKSGQPLKGKQLSAVFTKIDHHFTVGSTFSAWILENKATYKNTCFINEDLEIDLRKYDSLPAGRPIKGISIVEKVLSWQGKFLEPKLEKTLKGGWSERQKKFLDIDARLVPDQKFKFPVFHTNSMTYYVKDKPTDFDKMKIIVSVSSPYPKLYTDPIGCAAGDLRTYILVENEEHGKNILSYLNSKLFRFVWRKPGMISWKSLILPQLENKFWTNTELYELFDITEDEINIVENYAL